MTEAEEYLNQLIEQQYQKIEGLKQSIHETQKTYFELQGILKDAQIDLNRFLQHKEDIKNGRELTKPPLEDTPYDP